MKDTQLELSGGWPTTGMPAESLIEVPRDERRLAGLSGNEQIVIVTIAVEGIEVRQHRVQRDET